MNKFSRFHPCKRRKAQESREPEGYFTEHINDILGHKSNNKYRNNNKPILSLLLQQQVVQSISTKVRCCVVQSKSKKCTKNNHSGRRGRTSMPLFSLPVFTTLENLGYPL
ncbi:hypothetical protein ACOSP7_001693 [Xanthoceras sorbifolium]